MIYCCHLLRIINAQVVFQFSPHKQQIYIIYNSQIVGTLHQVASKYWTYKGLFPVIWNNFLSLDTYEHIVNGMGDFLSIILE